MLRKIIGTASVLALCIALGTAWAGDKATKQTAAGKEGQTAMAADKKQMSADKMQAMKAAMSKCSVCKAMVPHMDQLGRMKMEVVRLNDGIALVHSTSDATHAAVYHKAAKEVHAAGAACMTMTDAEAKTELCEHCQEVRSIMKAGAKMSVGQTELGDIMVITSADPALQTKISALGDKCAMMAASMEM